LVWVSHDLEQAERMTWRRLRMHLGAIHTTE
jgi:hypothetical protein